MRIQQKSASLYIACILLAFLSSSCSKPVQSSDTAVDLSTDKAETVANKVDNPCKAGGMFENGQCTCGGMTNDDSVSSQWGCIGNQVLRCLRKDGCVWNDKKYPQRTEIRNNAIYCGKDTAPQNLEGYICAFYSENDNKHQWECEKWNCDCNGVSIDAGDICESKGLVADNGGVYLTQEDKDKQDPVCGGIHYSEIPVDYKNHFACNNDKWTCNGELICARGKWYCVEDGYEDVELCENVCARDDYSVYSRCHDTKDENDGIVPCETLKRDEYDHYDEKYDPLSEPTCKGYLGGYCRYGYNIHKEAETCQPWDFSKFGGVLSNKAYHEYGDFGLMHGNVWLEFDEDDVCIEGNCKCGDGACPQYAYCKDGQCFCEDPIGTHYGEFYCDIKVGSPHTEWSIDSAHTVECRNKKGCRTSDGQTYKTGDIVCVTNHSFCEDMNDYGDYSICNDNFDKLPGCLELGKKMDSKPIDSHGDEASETKTAPDTNEVINSHSSETKPAPASVEVCRKGEIYDELLKRCVYVLNGFTTDKEGKRLSNLALEYSNGLIRRCVQGDYRDDGCHCGDIVIDDLVSNDCAIVHGKGYEICALSTGCDCGEGVCPNTTACVNGQCIDPITDKPIKSLASLPSLACHNGEHCNCGGTTCQEWEFCYHEQCLSHFYSSILDGRRRVFNLKDVYDYMSDSDNSEAAEKFNYSDYLYLQTEADDGYVIYPSIDCIRDYRDEECGDDPFCIVTGGPSGNECLDAVIENGTVRCDKREGCACGNSVCQWGSICNDGKCQYDSFYNHFWFDSEHNISSDENGNGICAGTILEPGWERNVKESYSCTDLGWTCRIKEGCACGDVQCPTGAICIQPGLCSESIEPCDSNLDIEAKCCSGAIDGGGKCCESGVLYGDDHRCCKTGTVGKLNGIWGWEMCCESGVLTPFGQCCPQHLVGQNGQCTCNKYIRYNKCDKLFAARDRSYARALNKNGYKCPDEYSDGDGHCSCTVFAESGQCCLPKYINADGQCQCKGFGGSNLNECCEYGIEDGLTTSVRCQGKPESKYSRDYRQYGWYCESGVVNETSVYNQTGFCCKTGVQNSKGGCCPEEFVGNDGTCQCKIDNDGRCCMSGLITNTGECCIWNGVRPDDYRPPALTKDGECCKFGVISPSGKSCCPRNKVDKDGKCKCKEDIHGSCCESEVLTKTGECCPEENVKKGKCVMTSVPKDNDSTPVVKDKLDNICETRVLSESSYCCPVHHVNEDGSCNCLADRFGKCCIGMIDSNGFCCESGVTDNRGYCCEDGVKNRFGWCCNSILSNGGNCIQ